jgi:hypothetical protein
MLFAGQSSVCVHALRLNSFVRGNVLKKETAPMGRKLVLIGLFAIVLFLSTQARSNEELPDVVDIPASPDSEIDPATRYRLFGTENVWTFILLDTTNGLAWQVHFSIDDKPSVKLPLNEVSLLPTGAKRIPGRYTLYATKNMYNFLLLDREDGRTWQVQWSLEPKNRGVLRQIRPSS